MTDPVRNLDSLGRRRRRPKPATTPDDLDEIEHAQAGDDQQARQVAAEEFTYGNTVRLFHGGRLWIVASLEEWDRVKAGRG